MSRTQRLSDSINAKTKASSICLSPVATCTPDSSTSRAVRPLVTDDERRTIAEMIAKGAYAMLLMATKDLDGTFARLQASDAEVVLQEPTEQPYGVHEAPISDIMTSQHGCVSSRISYRTR